MKRKYRYRLPKKTVEKEYVYIPIRYILAVLLSILMVATVIGIVVLCCLYIPYFYLLAAAMMVGCLLTIIASHDNPEYKIPWLLIVLLLPVAGFMLYFMFYSRKLKPKYIRRLDEVQKMQYQKDHTAALATLKAEDPYAASEASLLCRLSGMHLFENTKTVYYPLGEALVPALLADLKAAEHFIYMEYFIIEDGVFWGAILSVLKEKAAEGVEVKLLYDDIGCMTTLPGNYHKKLKRYGIEALPFSRLRGSADSEFNNRSHRKITVIDGKIGYTGGINLADEYIGKIERFGHWKDTAIRLEGEGVWALTWLFLGNFGLNSKTSISVPDNAYPESTVKAAGYLIPFGDGPRPIYRRRVSKTLLATMLAHAKEYAYFTSPYLILDNDLCTEIENAALRGVDVKIILPHIPDKKLIFTMTRSFYDRLLAAGVKIYEYTPGFIHAKNYIIDGKTAMIGTVNLDYRSLVHHFENAVWMYKTKSIAAMEEDFLKTLAVSEEIKLEALKTGTWTRFVRAVFRVFAPML